MRASDWLAKRQLDSDEVKRELSQAYVLGHRYGITGTLGAPTAYRLRDGEATGLVKNMAAHVGRRMEDLKRERRDVGARISDSEFKLSILKEAESFMSGSPKFQDPERSRLGELERVSNAGKVHSLDEATAAQLESLLNESLSVVNVFVVQHDWRGALSHPDMDGSQFRLPHEFCCFDMKISDHPVCALCRSADDKIEITVTFRTPAGWFTCPSAIVGKGANSDELSDMGRAIEKQIKAICIALDAEVLKGDVIREQTISRPADKKETPTGYAIHRLSLTRRPRAFESLSVSPSGRHVRLHWRRGHWRRYPTHKTWIKWMLCGNPDLGFVDKEYQL